MSVLTLACAALQEIAADRPGLWEDIIAACLRHDPRANNRMICEATGIPERHVAPNRELVTGELRRRRRVRREETPAAAPAVIRLQRPGYARSTNGATTDWSTVRNANQHAQAILDARKRNGPAHH